MSGLSGLLASSDLDMLGSAVLRTAWPGVALGTLALVWLWRTHWGSPIVRSRLTAWALAVAVGSPLAAGAHAQATLTELRAHRSPAAVPAWPASATAAAQVMAPAAPAPAPAPAADAAPAATPPMIVCPRADAERAARERIAAHAATAPAGRAAASAALEAAPARARLSAALRARMSEQLDRADLSRTRMQAIVLADEQLRVAMAAASATLTPAVRIRVQRLSPVPAISDMIVRIE